MRILILLIFGMITVAVVGITWYGKSRWIESPVLNQAELLNRWSQQSVMAEVLLPLSHQAKLPTENGGQIWLVHFWASWCGPCVEELPTLLKLCQTQSPQIRVIAISEDVDESTMMEFLKDHALAGFTQCPMGWVFDENHRWQKVFQVERLPETYLFDKGGRLIRQVSGGQDWLAPEIQAFLNSWMTP